MVRPTQQASSSDSPLVAAAAATGDCAAAAARSGHVQQLLLHLPKGGVAVVAKDLCWRHCWRRRHRQRRRQRRRRRHRRWRQQLLWQVSRCILLQFGLQRKGQTGHRWHMPAPNNSTVGACCSFIEQAVLLKGRM
jgi:hypothetical protein